MSTREPLKKGGVFSRGLASALAAWWLMVLMVPGAAQAAQTWEHETGTVTLDGTPQRIVALNWAATEALLLLGVSPVGVADRDGYPVWVQSPPLPDGVSNVGARSAPSLEAIAALEPDLIVTSSQLAPASQQLEGIAPVYVISVYDEGVQPFRQARTMLLTLGEMLEREARAHRVITDLERELDRQRQRLLSAGLNGRPVALVSFMDERHLRINAPNGLFQSALERLGLRNAWRQEGNFWGFSLVGLEALAGLPEARLVVLSPVAPGLPDTLEASPLWQHLPAVRNQEVYQVDPVWAFGGLHAVQRLGRFLTQALLDGGSDHVR